MPAKPKFTRIPKTADLISAGVPTEVIPTYCALTDYAHNKTGECYPKMETLASTLNRSVRTIQRHLHLLRELGLIEFITRRRNRGRYSSYLYRVVHIAASATGHGRRADTKRSIKRRTKQLRTPPKSPNKDFAEGYWWFFGKEAPPGAQEEWDRKEQARREEEARRRTEGYEWFFGRA